MAFWLEPRCQIGFFGEMNVNALEGFCFQFQKGLGQPMEVLISSGGGSTSVKDAMLAMMATAREQATLRTIGTGWVGSCAVPLLASGTKEHRFILGRNTTLMVHQIQYKHEPNLVPADELQAAAARTQYVMDQYIDDMARLTDRETKFWRDKLSQRGDQLLTAQEAVELGIADYVVDVLPQAFVPVKTEVQPQS